MANPDPKDIAKLVKIQELEGKYFNIIYNINEIKSTTSMIILECISEAFEAGYKLAESHFNDKKE